MQNFTKKLALFGMIALSGLHIYTTEEIDENTELVADTATQEDEATYQATSQATWIALNAFKQAENKVKALQNASYQDRNNALNELENAKSVYYFAYTSCKQSKRCLNEFDDFLETSRYIGIMP